MHLLLLPHLPWVLFFGTSQRSPPSKGHPEMPLLNFHRDWSTVIFKKERTATMLIHCKKKISVEIACITCLHTHPAPNPTLWFSGQESSCWFVSLLQLTRMRSGLELSCILFPMLCSHFKVRKKCIHRVNIWSKESHIRNLPLLQNLVFQKPQGSHSSLHQDQRKAFRKLLAPPKDSTSTANCTAGCLKTYVWSVWRVKSSSSWTSIMVGFVSLTFGTKRCARER